MSKQIQVNLAFNADTSKAKQQINDLVNSLNKISTKDSQIFDDKNLKDAASAAKDLTKYLEASVNVNTGKLDLNKFTQSLSQSKTSLTDLYNSLSKAGPEGQKAFSQLSSAIASSDSSVLNLNAKVKDLGTTLKNTIKWQLSSSLVHGFMGAMSQAVGYAKDLNSSLNDIRIVTGAGVDEMARFAEQANKSAKALSSTTTEYTKASLIYYQQGLSDSEVKERTDVTIKMANVSKESAQVVSDQMTAVWNNFYDGSKSLEYYADVMTALGAATASSVDEIAGGLEKFAAIGDTIGLSYEYAASALATITSNTRQSEEVVGTALKTIFARIQGLNLGETLDDGTTLNKYSAALDKVGISIFDQAGEIKNMDNILSEMGDKWQDLSKDQQIALAQTVAGTRQYTQLVALMDNWNNGDNDSFQANLQTAYGSEGTLQEQQDIYAESWEAAADRVKAATEDIYDSLINDEAIVVLLNGLEKILSFTGALIDGFGGLKGILLLVAGIFTRQIANEVPEALGKLKQNFEILTGKGQENKIKTLEEVATLRKPGENGPKEGTGAYTRAMADSQQASQMAELERIHSQLTDAQYNSAKAKIDEARASAELVANLQDEIAEKEKLFKQNKRNVKVENGDKKVSDRIKELDEEIGSTDEDKQAAEELYRSTRAKKQSDLTADETEWMASYERRKVELETLQQMDGTQTINQAIQGQMDKLAELYGKWSSLNQVIDDYQAQIESFGASADIIKSAGGINTEKGAQEFDELINSMKNYLSLLGEIDGVKVNIDGFDEAIANIKKLENTEEAEKAIENLISSFHKFANIQIADGQITQIGEEAIDAEGRMQKLENQIDEVRGALEGLTPEQFEKLAAAAEEAGIEIAGLQVTLRQQQNSNQQKGTPTQDLPTMEFSTALTKVAGLGMDVASLFSSLGSALSVCFDEGTSAGEKFIAVLSSMPAAAMSIAQITGALKDMPDALKTVSEGFSKLKEFSVTGSGLATVFGNIGTKLGSTAIAGTKMGSAIVSAFSGATTSVMSFWASLGLIAVALAAVVAVVWLVVKAFEAIQASTPEGKLKAAEEHTAAMAEAAKEANQAYQDLLNTINGYESAAGALDGLTKGTQEFTNKLIEANSKAQELIDTYGIAPDQYSVNEDTGLIEFNEGVLDEKQRQYSERAEVANSVHNSAKITESKQRQENAVGDLRSEVVANNTAEGFFTASKDTLEQYYQAMKEAGKGSIEGFYALSEEERKAALEGVEARDAEGINSWAIDNNIAALSNSANLEAMQKYQSIDNQESNQQLNTLKSDLINNLSNEIAYQNSDYKNAILDKVAGIDNYNDIKNQAKQDYNAKKPKDLAEDFKEAFGEDQYEYDKGKIYKKNEDGIRGEAIDKKTAVDMLASKDASDNMEQAALNFADIFNKIDASADDREKTYLDSMLNNKGVNALSRDEIEKLQVDGPLSIEDIFDTTTLNQLAEGGYGQEEIQAWLDSLNEQIADWQPEQFNLDTWKKDYAAKMDIVNDLETGDSISPEDYAILGEEYQQYFSEQLDGTYKLIGTANEFKAIVESIELGKLKEDMQSKKDQFNAAGGYMSEDLAQSYRDGSATNQQLVEAMGGTWTDDLEGQVAATQAAMDAYDQLFISLAEGSQTLAMTADSFEDLDELFAEGLITIEDYNKRFLEMKDTLDKDIDEDQYENLTEILQTMAEASDDNNEGALEFSQNLKDNKKAAQEVAKAILRYDSAVADVKKNSKEWMKILKSGNLQDMADIMDDLENSYNDLLDLDGDSLSDDFITNAENLELMEKAANGSAEAYDELARRAGQDILMQVGLDTSQYDADLAALNAQAQNFMGMGLADIEAGASLDNAAFLAACEQMINAAGMTAAQASNYLGSMGVDAEIEQEEVVSPETVATALTAQPYDIPWTYYVPSAWGTPMSQQATFPSVRYSTEPVPGEKKTTAVALRVKSATKSSGGGIKHANSSSGSGSNSKPSGGGGGGSKKEPKYAEKKSSSEKTRYHTLQNQLEDLTAEYDKLADASDRAFGQDKLDAIDAEIKKTDELIDKQEEYLQAIQSDLPVDKSVMTAYYNDTIGGPAMQFDENGNISNYDQIQDAMFNKYNAMTAYDEDSLEWQTFEKKYEQLEKYIEQYEETYDLLREEEANYQDLLNQRIDLELEKVEYKVEIQLEVPENQKEVIEYQLGRIEDDAKKTGEALALLTEQAEMTYDQILINKQGLNDALELSLSAAEITEVMAGNMDVLNGKTFTEDQISAIQDYKDNLLELNEEFDDIRESIEETVLEAFDMWHEKLEEGIEKFDYFGTILESYQSIIDTVGKDTLGISDSLINTLSQASVDNAINEVEATRDAYKALQQAQIDAERELEKAKARGDEQSISFWESTLNEIQQNAEDAHEEMLSSWEEALSKIVEQFEASIQTAVDAFNEAVYQLGGIEALSEEFDRQKEMADMYLDDYQKIYELSKLNRDVNNSIDDTDSLAGKQKLKKLLGEINKLQADGVKMSEYDLEYLQAEYDLRLAEIALEEAQRAKDVVRLSRDNEGNWSYVYTQNTEAVDEAQQKYEDALYAMQDLSSNYIDEISAQLIETSQEMQEALAAIRIEDYASIEEYYEEVERVQEQYQEQLALQEEELNKAVVNNKELYDTDWTNYHNAVGYKISDTEEFATKFSDTLLGTLMNSESDTSNFTNILADATSTLMNELYGAAEQYYTNMAAAMEAAGTTTGTFADDLATNVDQIKQDSEEAATAVEDMATHMQEQMDNIINKVGEWQRIYGEAMNEIINANLAVIDSFNEMLATLSMDDSTVTVKYDIQNHNSDVLDAERFATGGYTGSWGNTGRLGILDEKELILNKDDTENFIEALKISRSMLNTIELNARQASLGLGTLIPTTVKDDIKETLEQVVQITAEFPNATDHNEIEEAFNMLINRASQFANRK